MKLTKSQVTGVKPRRSARSKYTPHVGKKQILRGNPLATFQ